MRKLFLFGLILAFSHANVEADQVLSHQLIKPTTACCEGKPECRPGCIRGPKGSKGPKGDKGSRGERGRTGLSLEINDIIYASTKFAGVVGTSFINFDPITSSNGINSLLSGGMSLVESVPLSNNFDTIILPKEDHDTFYSVTNGISLGFPRNELISGDGIFQLVLNGNILNYTAIQILGNSSFNMINRTNVIVNPAHTVGTLRVYSSLPGTFIEPATALGFSAYITVVKLNQNGTS